MDKARERFLQRARQVLPRAQIARIQRCFYETISFHKTWEDVGNNTNRCVVQGSTGQHVVLWKNDTELSCSCPDFIMCKRENMLCKHICYVLLGISVSEEDLGMFLRLSDDSRANRIADKQKHFLMQQQDCDV